VIETLLQELKKLEGKTLYTLAQNKEFNVVKVSNKEVVLTVSTGKSRPIPFWKFQKARDHLEEYKKLTLVEIRELEISDFNPTYIAAVLAGIPGVSVSRKPISLYLKE
jgi:hypothetical protein